jgi:hypothetical protein
MVLLHLFPKYFNAWLFFCMYVSVPMVTLSHAYLQPLRLRVAFNLSLVGVHQRWPVQLWLYASCGLSLCVVP